MGEHIMRRDLRQMSLADGVISHKVGRNDWLTEIDRLIDWAAVSVVLKDIYSSGEGRPSYPVLTLTKLLLLQQWYTLSDPGLEEAVDDRLSFRRFAGLPLDESTPDHATIWRFRQRLQQHGVDKALFQEINRQLDGRGLILRQGTLIDASIVKAAVKPPSYNSGTVSERDPEAGWTTKNGTSTFGYKVHIATDEGSGLIREAILTGADLHDSLLGPSLVQGDEAAVYADKAYGSKAFRQALTEAGIKDGVMHKAHRQKPLKKWQIWLNKAITPIRSAVERAFAVMKRHYGYRQVRYLGLARNQCHLSLMATAINLRRALALTA
jgi:transposase, IS5 family